MAVFLVSEFLLLFHEVFDLFLRGQFRIVSIQGKFRSPRLGEGIEKQRLPLHVCEGIVIAWEKVNVCADGVHTVSMILYVLLLGLHIVRCRCPS